MILFPAIDLKDGACVRLKKGVMDSATIFNDDPAEQAGIFERQGFKWIHIVDLNGAFAGRPVNIGAVKSIIANVKIPLQLGGGIRDLTTMEIWLDAGIRRIILGTIALENPVIVKEACRKFPGRIVVGIDGYEGKVAVHGWAKTSDVDVISLAKKYVDYGVSAILYTDIKRDGMLKGPDLTGTLNLASAINIPVIASGGVAKTEDIQAVKDVAGKGISGVVIGRALYEGKIDINKALEIANA